MNASHHPGRARRLRAALFVLGLLACKPKLPPVSGCTPNAHRCEADSPEVCSPTQRWHRVGDLPCREVGARCAVLDAGVAACVPMDDAGSDGAVPSDDAPPTVTDGGAE